MNDQPTSLKGCCRCKLDKDEPAYSPAEWEKSVSRRCRECIRAKNKATIAKSPEKLAERNRKYYEENREAVREAQRARYVTNREVYNANSKAYNETNRVEISLKRSLNKDSLSYKSWVHRLRRVYGLTPDDYARMLEEQSYGCAICGTDSPGNVGGPTAARKVFAVDHCHTSGKVRGLLCHHCNRGLGLFRDNPTALRLAAEYVRECH